MLDEIYGPAMQALARSEGHMKRLPDWKPAVDHEDRNQVILDALKDGPKTRQELAEILGISDDRVRQYMYDVTRPGPDGKAKVRKAGKNKRKAVLFELVGEN